MLQQKKIDLSTWQNTCWWVVTIFLWLFFLLFSISVRKTDALLAICFLGVFTLLTAKYDFSRLLRPNKTTPWILFLLCFVSRLTWCNFMAPKMAQVSDFLGYLNTAAEGDFSSKFYFYFPHKAMYPLLLRALGISTQEGAFFFQCLCVSVIPMLLYRMGTRVKNEKLGLLAAVIYLIWPGQLVYTAIVTEEHIVAVMLTGIAALLLDIYHAIDENKTSPRPFAVKLVCTGTLCAISALFRDFASIILIAAILCGFALLPKWNKVQRKNLILAIVVLLLSRTVAHIGLTAALNHSTGLQMHENIVVGQMYWSLDPDGWGGYDKEGIEAYYDLIEKHDNDLELANREALQILWGKIRAGYYKMPTLLLKKGVSSYADDEALFYWPNASIIPAFQNTLSGIFSILQSVGRTFYLTIVLCLLLCTLFRKRDIFFVLVIIVGAVAANLLIESQGRYKYVVEPLWTVAAAYAFYALADKTREIARSKSQEAFSGEITGRAVLRGNVLQLKTAIKKWTAKGSYTAFCLSVMGLAIGILALGITAHSCPALHSNVLLRSYFNNSFLLLMNLLPGFILIWLGYFLLHRVWAAYLFSAIPTIGLAFINYYKVKLRDDPFYPTDLLLARTAGGVFDRYSFPVTGTVILAAICFTVGLLWCIFLCKRKGNLRIWQRVAGAFLCVAISWCFSAPYTNYFLWAKERYQEPYNNYNPSEYYVVRGIWYPFIYYIQNVFHTAPEGYDHSEAREELLSYENSNIPEEKKVNIIGVMLEAFSDLTDFPAVAAQPGVAEMYQPLHDLESRSVHGNLLTDVFGGGTCVTEWASLSGSNAYSSYLTDVRSNQDSYVWYLRSQGYNTVFTHPNVKWMYNRQNVIPWLGFEEARFYEDSFSGKITQEDAFFYSDPLLFDLLLDDVAIHSNQHGSSPTFSFSVSYQNHGAYSATELVRKEIFPEEGSGMSHEAWVILNNYLGGIADTIQQIQRLTNELEANGDPYVVYLFGDHKPWLGNGASVYHELGINLDLSTLEGYYNYYSTPYLIWANSAAKEALEKDMIGEGGDFSPCLLMQELFDTCGWEGPGFMKLAKELRSRSPLISFNNVFLENGQLTDTLSPDTEDFYKNYLFMQYYRKQYGLKELYG